VAADLSVGPLDESLPRGPFDLVCSFGLLHHIPAFARRRALVECLAARVARGGRLALAFWRFAERERFTRRRVDWATAPEIDESQLEPGDHLLAWGDAGASRYCHASDDAEIEALLAAVPLTRCDDFEADGREGTLNRYLVLGRTHG
jgi:SAM-dependent methyltransferase